MEQIDEVAEWEQWALSEAIAEEERASREEEQEADLSWFGQEWMRQSDRYQPQGSYLSHLVDNWARDRELPIERMMSEHERYVLSMLPDRLRVYRGCWDHNADRPSWTLRRRTAMDMWNGQVELLITGEVEKRHVIALLLRYGEHEVLSHRVHEVRRERIQRPESIDWQKRRYRRFWG